MRSKLDGELVARVQAFTAWARSRTSARSAPPVPDTAKVSVLLTGNDAVEAAAVEAAGFVTRIRAGRILFGTAALGDLERIAELDEVVSVQANRRSDRLDTAAPVGAATHSGQTPPAGPGPAPGPQGASAPAVSEVTGRGVLLGMLDSGIDIYHPAFQEDGRTLITQLVDVTLRQEIRASPHLNTTALDLRWTPPPTRLSPTPRTITAVLPFPVTLDDFRAVWTPWTPEIQPGDVQVEGGPFPDHPLVVTFGGQYNSDVVDSRNIPDVVCYPFPYQQGPAQFLVDRAPLIYDQAEIDAALQDPDGVDFAFRDADGHGTATASVAVGAPRSHAKCGMKQPYFTGGMAPGAGLVMARCSNGDDSKIVAVTHMIGLAARRNEPLVISISYGRYTGPHDGTDHMELYLSGVIGNGSVRAVAVAAGNEGAADPEPPSGTLLPPPGGLPTRGWHTSGTVAANGRATRGIFVAYRDRRSDGFEIWYSGPARLTFDLTAPFIANSESLPSPVAPPAEVKADVAHHPVEVSSVLGVPPYGKNRITFSIDPVPAADMITMGVWTITLQETSGTAADFDIWVDSAGEHRLSRFRFAEQDRTRTLSSPGCALLAITVGGHDEEDRELARSSSRGPLCDPGRTPKPEVCAPGIGVWVAQARKWDTFSYAPENGTSFAAPYVAGVVALMLEAAPHLTHAEIKKRLIASCDPPVSPHQPVPPEDLAGWGAGRVNPAKAVERAREPAVARTGPVVLPTAAYPAWSAPLHARAAELRRQAETSPAGRTLAALATRHAAEVSHLVGTERRVTAAWHRMHGPALLGWLLADAHREIPVPRMLGGKSLAAGIGRLLDELALAGSPALRADATAFRALLLALPGVPLADLTAYDDHGQGT
ncbi:S8 family serine peptidase [Streptomyces sp. NPDC001502]|uniref:S8 family serine peptidase n=1 Tax=Streptomyces sp. NPDC001502 TaxID=3364578 RepID=UPI0036D025D0